MIRELRESELLNAVLELRSQAPRIGAYKLFIMLCRLFGREQMPGRDRFYALLRRKGLMLKPSQGRRTTNSNHRFHKYKNLIQGFIPSGPNQLWVSDITYISLVGGVCYLHLVTDAYSRKIIGWRLAPGLHARYTVEALNMAISQVDSDCLEGLIHHSDRGTQYCCEAYVKILTEHHIRISMTEDYKPTDNAIAERVNGIIKQEWLYYQQQFKEIMQAEKEIGRIINFYNCKRPHRSNDMMTPEEKHIRRDVSKAIKDKKLAQMGGIT